MKPQCCDSSQASSSDLNCAAAAISAALLYRSGFIKHESSVTTSPARRGSPPVSRVPAVLPSSPESKGTSRSLHYRSVESLCRFRPQTCFAHPHFLHLHDDGSLALSPSAMVLRSTDRRLRRSGRSRPSLSFGHSPRSGVANSADSAGTNVPKAAPPEAPRMATARPYRRRETMVTRTPWNIA